MNKKTTLVIFAIMVACISTSAIAGQWLFYGNVYYNGSPVQGAIIRTYHDCETNGWSGIATAGSPDTSDANGYFDVHAYYPNDWSGYYDICITYGNLWKHCMGVNTTAPYGISLDTLVLQTGTHTHPACQ